MSNQIDLIYAKSVEEQLGRILPQLEAHHKKIIDISKEKVDFFGGKTATNPKQLNDAVNSFEKIKKSTAELTAIEKERLRIEKELERVNAKIKTSTDQNTIALNTQKSVLKAVNGYYAELSEKLKRAKDDYQNLIARGRLANQSMASWNKELRTAQREFDGLNQKVLKADKAVGAWNRTNERVIVGFRSLLGAFGIAGATQIFANLVMDSFNLTRELESMNNALKQVTGSSAEFGHQQEFLQRIAKAYGVDIVDLTKQFTQFYVSAKDKISGQQIQDIFESITKAGAKMGLSTESQKRAFLALNQMMSKGTIQAEELRGQLGEALPGAFSIMARAVGVTEKELGALMKTGDVIASEVLPEFAKELEKTYGILDVKKVESLTASVNRLSNAWTNFIANLDTGDGVMSRILRRTIQGWANGLDQITEYFKTDAQKRKEQIENIRTWAGEEAQIKIDAIKDDKKRQEYMDSMLEKSQAKREEIFQRGKAIEDKIRQTRDEQTRTDENGRTELSRWGEKEIQRLGVKLAGVNNILARYDGYIDAFSAKKSEVDKEDEESDKKRKERLRKEKEAREALAKAIEEELASRSKLKVAELTREIGKLDVKLKNDKLYYKQRLELLDEYAKLQTQKELEIYAEDLRINQKKYDDLVKRGKLEGQTEAQFQDELRNYKKATENQMTIDAIEFKNKIDKINEDRTDKGLAELKRYYDEFDNYNEKYDGEGLKLKLFGDDPKADFEKWKDGAKGATKETENLKKATEDWVASFRESFFGEVGFDTLFDILEGKLDVFGDNWEATMIGIAEVAKETITFISRLSDQRFEREYNNLEKQYQTSRKFAGDNADAQAEIDRQYEAKLREIRIREFKAKKRLAIVEANINIAQGVIASLAKGGTAGIVMAGIIGALGIVQLATIQNQEMPEYWKGTDNHIGGLMKVNDQKGGNYQEAVVLPNKKVILPQGRDIVMNAPRGTKVYNADKTREMLDSMMFNDQLNNILSSNGIGSSFQPNNTTLNDQNIVSELREVVRAIDSIPVPSSRITNGDLENFIETKTTRIKQTNARRTFTPRNT